MTSPARRPAPAGKHSLPWRVVRSVLRIVLLTYLGLVAFLFFFQSIFIYAPVPGITTTPAVYRLPYEDVWFEGGGGKINGWYIPGKPGAATVLFCHPNAGNLSSYVETVDVVHGLGLNLFMFDYRGYGLSAGKPSEAGTYADAAAARAWLEKNHSPSALIIWGRSLGGAHAARLAADRPPRALIIESAFSSFPAVARDFFPYLPVGMIAHYAYPTADDAVKITCPTLVIHSPEDEIVDFRHGRIIYDRLSCPKQFLQISGDHNTGYMQTGLSYEQGIRRFLEKYGLM